MFKNKIKDLRNSKSLTQEELSKNRVLIVANFKKLIEIFK